MKKEAMGTALEIYCPKKSTTQVSEKKPVSFHISFSNLKDMDKFLNGKTDPYAIVNLTTVDANGKPQSAQIAKTKYVKDKLDGSFDEKVVAELQTGLKQTVEIVIMDDDLGKDEEVGHWSFELSALVG